ncbi:MAG TPA: FAD-binding oxidoreductase [Acidimicrobiales bacterium]|jgi:alkyldihydroxyacetonephosphate synthase|nr:FAD-binding oxidoreductase [Acidimicrobiales bacterium]
MATRTPEPGSPTPPIALAGGAAAVAAHLPTARVDVDDRLVERLRATGADVATDGDTVGEASRDWWPLAMIWATEGEVAGLGGAVVRPSDAAQVTGILAACNEARVPVTATGGRSGVCGAAVPVFGGVVLDLTGLSGIVSVDDTSMIVDVQAGTFGDRLEDELQARHGVTIGHWPQSITLATVGGWLACRGAGQYSTRYGKIEQIVVGLDVVLADGRTLTTGGQPASAVGPDLNQLFVGSEGTLGVITGARLKLHPKPPSERRGAWTFDDFAAPLDVCRRILRRGATPAVLRLHDTAEAARFGIEGQHLLLALDEGDAGLVDATMALVAEEAVASGGVDAGTEPVAKWLEHRNDVAALEAMIGKGYVVDTMEIAGPWTALPRIHDATTAAMQGVAGTLIATCHQSHAYVDGACLYFTFAAKVEPDDRERYYREVWDAGTRTVLANGGALSHHHGIGLNRSRFMAEALGGGLDVLAAVKAALDPHGILNPGKLGLASPFGPLPWPAATPTTASPSNPQGA